MLVNMLNSKDVNSWVKAELFDLKQKDPAANCPREPH